MRRFVAVLPMKPTAQAVLLYTSGLQEFAHLSSHIAICSSTVEQCNIAVVHVSLFLSAYYQPYIISTGVHGMKGIRIEDHRSISAPNMQYTVSLWLPTSIIKRCDTDMIAGHRFTGGLRRTSLKVDPLKYARTKVRDPAPSARKVDPKDPTTRLLSLPSCRGWPRAHGSDRPILPR